MRSPAHPFVIAVLLLLSDPVAAAHITDRVVAGMYEDPALEGSPLRLLTSGTTVEVLQRDGGRVEVEVADGTRGWVDAGYVTDEVPAAAELLETQARLRQMGLALAALREAQAADEAAATPGADASSLREALDRAEARIAGLERRLAEAADGDGGAARLEELRRRVDAAMVLLAGPDDVAPTVPAAGVTGFVSRYRVWIIGLTALVLGFVAGIAFLDHRFRRRHGGFRL